MKDAQYHKDYRSRRDNALHSKLDRILELLGDRVQTTRDTGPARGVSVSLTKPVEVSKPTAVIAKPIPVHAKPTTEGKPWTSAISKLKVYQG